MRTLFWTTLTSLVILSAASPAEAKLVINLRFPDGTTTRTLTPAEVGTAIPFQVWASVDNELAPADNLNGTGTHEGLQLITYSLVSRRSEQSSISGNMQNAVLAPPFNANASQVGENIDLNADGIRDYGNLQDPQHSNLAVRPRSPGGTPTFDEPVLWDDAGLQYPTVNYIAGGIEYLLETVKLHVVALGSSLSIDSIIPYWAADAVLPGALWWQDADVLLHQGQRIDGLNSKTYFAGTPITFTASPVPEPPSVALFAAGIVAGGVWRGRKLRAMRRER